MTPFPSIIGTTSTPGGSGPLVFYVPAALTYGQWATIDVMTGNDTITAGNINTGPTGVKIDLDFVAARTIDWIYGGDYTLYSGAVSIGSVLTINAIKAVSGVRLLTTAVLLGDTGSFVQWHGVAQFFGYCQFTSAGSVEFDGPTTYSGAVAYRVGRKTSITNSTSGFPAQAWDTAWMYNSGSAYDVVLSDPNTAGPGSTPLPEEIRCKFVVPGGQSASGGTYQTLNTGTINVKDSGGGVIASFSAPAAGTIKSIMIETVLVSSVIKWDLVDVTRFIS